jgi:hypothetical protein
MNKKISLGLIASSVLFAGNLSADTLSEAFENGKVSGEIKSQYFQKESNNSETTSIWTNGGNLSYKTGSFYGLSAGVTFQVASTTAEDLDEKPDAFDADQNVSGAVMSESYLQYTRGNTTAKLGRQYISTPLVAGSGTRIFKESFEAYTIQNSDLPNTTITASYVTKFQGRTDGNEGAPKFNKLGDGVYSIYVTNNSIDNLNLAGQYVKATDMTTDNKDITLYYLNGSYDFGAFKLGAQYYGSDDDNTADTGYYLNNRDGYLYALKASTNIGDLSLGLAYSEVSDKGGVSAYNLGNGADYIYTWTWMYGGVYDADTTAYSIDGSYKFTDKLSASFIHANWEIGNSGDMRETDLIVDYKFTNALSARLLHADLNDNAGYGKYRSRLYVSYKF